MTNIYRDEIIPEAELPKELAPTLRWRREAGSYGKDVRGLNRLHQFDKVEIVRVERPEDSYRALEEMKDHVQGLLEKLDPLAHTASLRRRHELHVGHHLRFRGVERGSVTLARGVVGIQFRDIPGQPPEISYRGADKKIHLCHTLNGSALALPRIVAALLENNQTPRGHLGARMSQKIHGLRHYRLISSVAAGKLGLSPAFRASETRIKTPIQ